MSVDTVTRHCYSFTADKDYSCRVRIICNTATVFTGQKIHLYLVEGNYAEEQIRSWAGYDELLQVEEDSDQKIQDLTDREDARWVSTHDGLENILIVSDRARKNNMVKMIDSSVRNSAGEVSATATALGILDRAGVVVNGIMSGEMGASILKISEPMHLEQGKTYTVHIVDDDPPAPYSMFFYKIGSSACLQQGGSNRGVSAIGSRFEQVIPDVTGDYQMGVYSTSAIFSSHMVHAYMYEGADWSMDDFYAYPKSEVLAAVISEMAAVKDDVRKKNLVRMLGNKGFRDGTGIYRLNAVGMPDPAGLVLNGSFGTASTTTYTNISEVFHLEAGQSYTILVRDILIHGGVAQGELRAAHGIALHADAEHLAFHAGLDLGKVKGLGEDFVDGLLVAHPGSQPVGRNALEAVPCPDVHGTSLPQRLRQILGNAHAGFAVVYPESAGFLVGRTQRQRVALGMGEEGGMKSAPRPCFLQNSTHGAKCFGSSLSRSTHSPEAKMA